MKTSNKHLLNDEDRLTATVTFGFLSTPLFLLLGAGSLIAL